MPRSRPQLRLCAAHVGGPMFCPRFLLWLCVRCMAMS